MIKLNNISFFYNQTPVLKDLQLTVQTGERIVLMGESGCGKTTILKLITGQLTPTKGTVENDTKRISYMFQEPRLLPWMTALENINLVLGDHKESLPEAAKWLKRVGLSDSANKYPHELSGGMQQRVALARALAHNGDLYLLDEPFSALDEDAAEAMIELVKTYTTNKTVIMVTHNSEYAKQFADTIYVIKKQKA